MHSDADIEPFSFERTQQSGGRVRLQKGRIDRLRGESPRAGGSRSIPAAAHPR